MALDPQIERDRLPSVNDISLIIVERRGVLSSGALARSLCNPWSGRIEAPPLSSTTLLAFLSFS
jgi:hypothetical protein